MGSKHISELLIEANNKISKIIDFIQGETTHSKEELINDLNTIIRQLDHLVEELEKN